MSSREVVGHLKGARDPINVEWEIADFLSLPAQVDESRRSSTFFFCDSTWYLKLYANGETRNSSEGHIGVYLFKKGSGPPVTATYSLFFKRTDGMEVILKEEKDTFGKESPGWGETEAIKRSDLIKRKSKFLPSGVLTVVCSMRSDETRGVGGTEKLLSDLKSLSISGDESDVTVRVQSEEFRLHRGILAARTPVFGAMFKHDMQEKATGVVTVVDCEAVPFRAFVQYLYTGSTDVLSEENVFGVYKTADKYQVDELKRSCLDYMKLNLSVDTFCETLGLALQHEERDLVEHATDFLSENARDIMVREDWQTLMKSNTKEMCECIGQAFVRKDQKLVEAEKKMI